MTRRVRGKNSQQLSDSHTDDEFRWPASRGRGRGACACAWGVSRGSSEDVHEDLRVSPGGAPGGDGVRARDGGLPPRRSRAHREARAVPRATDALARPHGAALPEVRRGPRGGGAHPQTHVVEGGRRVQDLAVLRRGQAPHRVAPGHVQVHPRGARDGRRQRGKG